MLSTVLIAFSIDGIFCLSKASFFKSEVYATIISGFAIISFADLKIGASASDKCDLEFLFSPSSTVTQYMASKNSSDCKYWLYSEVWNNWHKS